MTVSSYLQAFLSVYGWEFYYIFYLMLGSVGLFIYPILQLFINVFIEYMSGNEYSGHNYQRQLMVQMIIIILVFVIALVPVINVSFDKLRVTTICGEETMTAQEYNETSPKGRYFANQNTRVPLMPWAAMALGSGVSNLLYQKAPCLIDVTKMKNATYNLDLSGAENPSELENEYKRYGNECHVKILDAMDRIRRGQYGKQNQEWYEKTLRQAVINHRSWLSDVLRSDKLTSDEENQLLLSADSPLIEELFYQPNAKISEIFGGVPFEDLPFNAESPVAGYNGYTTGSTEQGQAGTPPSCGDWWRGQGGHNGLRQRLVSGLSDTVIQRIADGEVDECDPPGIGPFEKLDEATLKRCKAAVVRQIYSGDEDKLNSQLLHSLQGNYRKDDQLSRGEKLMLAADAVGISISGASLTGVLTNIYGLLYLMKLLMRYLIPMNLMVVFMFWGVYMVLGGMRGATMVKGMVLIFSLTIIPALWAWGEYLDDKLWDALYTNSVITDPFNALLLDAASTMFQLSVVMIVFYIIGMASGVNANSAASSGHESQTARSTAGNAGKGASSVARWTFMGGKSGGKTTGGALIPRSLDALKNRNK